MTSARDKLRLLFIEDHEDARELYRLAFEDMGHDVDVAGDSMAGLELAQSGDHHVIVIDIGLPGLDGYELARALTAAPLPQPRMLVALTGYARPEDRERALGVGFHLHLAKPVDLTDLERRIRIWFEARATPATPA